MDLWNSAFLIGSVPIICGNYANGFEWRVTLESFRLFSENPAAERWRWSATSYAFRVPIVAAPLT